MYSTWSERIPNVLLLLHRNGYVRPALLYGKGKLVALQAESVTAHESETIALGLPDEGNRQPFSQSLRQSLWAIQCIGVVEAVLPVVRFDEAPNHLNQVDLAVVLGIEYDVKSVLLGLLLQPRLLSQTIRLLGQGVPTAAIPALSSRCCLRSNYQIQ